MKLNRNVFSIIAAGLVIAIGVAMLVKASMVKPVKDETGQVVTKKILVAAKNLKIGDDLDEEDLRWQEWPEKAMFKGAILHKKDKKVLDAISGRMARDVSKNEPILRSMVITEEKGNFLAASMEPGMRAMAIKVSAETSAGGFISPSDYVDVILTHEVRIRAGEDAKALSATINRYASQTVLENIRVLAVDQKSKRKAEDEKAKAGRTVTVEVTSKQAEKLSLASAMGDLSLVLRKLGDESKVGESDLTTDVMVSSALKEMAAVSKKASSVRTVVRVYNGNTVQEISVRPSGE